MSGAINYGRSIAGEVTSITNATYQNLPQNAPNPVWNVVNGPDRPVSYTLGNGLNYRHLSPDDAKERCAAGGVGSNHCNGNHRRDD